MNYREDIDWKHVNKNIIEIPDDLWLNENFVTLLIQLLYRIYEVDDTKFGNLIIPDNISKIARNTNEDLGTVLLNRLIFYHPIKDCQQIVPVKLSRDQFFLDEYELQLTRRAEDLLNTINKIPKSQLENYIIHYSAKSLILRNKTGINADPRGIKLIDYSYGFCDSIGKEGNIIFLDELASLLYTIKSHKFDLYFELFDEAKASFYDGELRIDLEFAHGS